MTRSVRWLAIAAVLPFGCTTPAEGIEELPSLGSAIDPPPPPITGTPQTWRSITTPMPGDLASPTVPQLMQDGTIVIQDECTDHWWKYAPDEFGQYDDGTWSQLASSNGYDPLFTAQAVLPDGRMIVEGGEYLGCQEAWTTQGAIYDPVADSWQSVAPPPTWTSEPSALGDPTGGSIGDAESIVLPDGTFMLSNCCTPEMAKLDPTALTWTPAGQGKADINDEESWSPLQDGRIVTADAEGGPSGTDLQTSEIYDPATDIWSLLPDVPVQLDQIDPSSQQNSSHEVGPEMTRPDGTIVAIGGTPHNAVFDPTAMAWTALSDSPNEYASVDGPGATLPNGDVLVALGPQYDPGNRATGGFDPPTVWYELSGTTFTQVGGTTDDPGLGTYSHFLLLLPTGEVLHTQEGYAPGTTLQIYTPPPGVAANAVPEILGEPELIGSGDEPATAPVPTLYRGRSYRLPIARMNGLDLGAVYGDDLQASTDFPIVRLTAADTGHVWYCRTHDPSDRSTSPDERGRATFDVPAAAEGGIAQITVIANGIASEPVTVNVK